MGFRDKFRGKSKAQEKQKSGSTWSVETGGHKFALHREKHYASRNDSPTPTSTPPALPPRRNTTFPIPPMLPPRSISQQSAPAVLQHPSEPAAVRQSDNFLTRLLPILLNIVIPQKPQTTKEAKKSSGRIWMLACLAGLTLFLLVAYYTIVPISTALAIGGFAYAVTAIFLHYLNSQDRRHEITVTAQKEVMIAMVNNGHGATMASGFLQSDGSRSRLLEYR